jgi:hypothetical protein
VTSDTANLRTAGARPTVEILSPAAGTRVRSDTNLVLEGQAFDDAGRPIRARRLQWRSGKRRLGRGARIDVEAHRLGGTITLRARDSAGRVGSDSARLRIQRVAPFFTSLSAGTFGRGIRLRVGSSLPGRLVVSGPGLRRASARVRPNERTVRVRFRGTRRDSYTLRLRLKAGGRTTAQQLVVE